ncbi:MAG: response regulator [Gammaproteobacteria bacterium]|nr:response regulator [Gammaproteobacteria bacterium]
MTNIIPTVVVVDDSLTANSLYQMSASDLAVELRTFQSADQAIEHLTQNQPDLMFLDIVMPEKDGITLLKELRAIPIHSDTPVIMVTSKDYAQDRVVAKELGALEFLIKPLRSREIRELICKYTDAEEKEIQ